MRPARSRNPDLVHPASPTSPKIGCVHRCLRPATATPPYVPFSDVLELAAGAAVMSQSVFHNLHSVEVSCCRMCVSPASHIASFTDDRYCFALSDIDVTLP